MHSDRTARERTLLATILTRNPDFGTVGYLAELPPQPTMIELLERIHTPNAAGPGPAQRPQRMAD